MMLVHSQGHLRDSIGLHTCKGQLRSVTRITLNFWRSCFITSSVRMVLFVLTLVSDPKVGVKMDV